MTFTTNGYIGSGGTATISGDDDCGTLTLVTGTGSSYPGAIGQFFYGDRAVGAQVYGARFEIVPLNTAAKGLTFNLQDGGSPGGLSCKQDSGEIVMEVTAGLADSTTYTFAYSSV